MDCFRRFTKTVPVRTGVAVVFENTIPHRFSTIKNGTEVVQRRLFLSLFVVDPNDTLDCTTANTMSPGEISTVLTKKGITSPDLQRHIDKFFGGYSNGDFLHRKIVRDRALSAMSSSRQHWKARYYDKIDRYQKLIYFEFWPDARYPLEIFDVDRVDYHFSEDENYEDRKYEHSGVATSELGSGL